MISLSPDSSLLPSLGNLFSQPRGATVGNVSAVEARSQTTSGLSIVTAEGDRVTLTTSASFSGGGLTYNANGVVESLHAQFSSQKHISIEGDLNEQEIKEIQNIIHTVNALRDDVALGDVEAVLANAQQLTTAGSIASIDLSIQHTESLAIQETLVQRKPEIPQKLNESITIEDGKSFDGTPPLLARNKNKDSVSAQTALPPFPNQEINEVGTTGQGSSKLRDGLENPSHPLFPKFFDEITNIREGKVKKIEGLSEKVLNKAEKISRLAEKLHRAVDNTTRRIEKDNQKISDLLHKGDLEDARKLQERTDRRLSRLGKTVERLSSRIEKTAEKLDHAVESLTDRLQKLTGQSRQSIPSTNSDSGETSQDEAFPVNEPPIVNV